MTLAAINVQNTYNGDGTAKTYPFTFPLFEVADVSIALVNTNVTPNVSYTLQLTQDFTVVLNPTGADQYLGGTITLVNKSQIWLSGGFLKTGWTITISRIMALTQTTSIRNQGSYYPETIEDALDYLMMVCQQINAGLGTSGGSSGGGGSGGGTSTSLIITDNADGHTYKVVSQNGVLGLQLNT